MKIRKSTIIIWILTICLTLFNIWLFVRMIWQPDIHTVEFTNHDIVRAFNKIPLVNISEPQDLVQYIAFHIQWVGLLAFWPLLCLPAYHTLSDFPKWQRVLSTILRFCLLSCIVLALTDIEKTSETSKVSVIYVVDVSASVPDDMLQNAHDEIARDLQKKTPETDIQIVTFAQHPQIVKIPENGELPAFSRHSTGDDDDESQNVTDIESALRFSYALFPENHVRRIVLMGDGNQTQGDLLAEAARARLQDIRIDVRHITAAPIREVLIKSLDVHERDNLHVSKPFEIVVQIESTHETDVELTLDKNDVRDTKNSQTIHLEPGDNFVTLKTESDTPGMLKCKFALQNVPQDEDRFAENNILLDEFNIQGKPKILYIEQNSSNASYLQRALSGYQDSQGQGFDVEVRGSTGLPTSMRELSKYSAVILGDVPRETNTGRTNVTTESMNLVQDYVKRQGGGFIAIGGQDAFGPGGYQNTPVEKILPVEFKNETPQNKQSSAIALVIDKSGSMSDQGNLEIAKEAAKASVSALNPQDRVLVVGFDDTPYVVVPLTRAINRSNIHSKISKMQPSGGTNIRDALEMAYLEMMMVSAKTKHVILLTDGYSSYTGIDALVREMAKSRITVSTVAMASADTTLLSRIANLGKGRAYIARDSSSVPRIFVEETNRVTNQAIVESPFVPTVSKNHEMIKGVSFQTLLGYVGTKAKSGSQVILKSPTGAPILAHWSLGTGKTTAFTSDAKNRWASAWIKQSSNFAKFWAQVVRSTMKTEEETRFDMIAQRENDRVRLIVDAISEDDTFLNYLNVDVEVTLPDGEKTSLNLPQTAPGFYENTMPLSMYGTYQANAVLKRDQEELGIARKTFTFPYTQEFAHPEPNFALLDAAATSTGGKIDVDFNDTADPGDFKLRSYSPIWYYFLWLAFICLIIDIASRRVRLARS